MNMIQWLNDMISAPVKKPIPILSFPSVSLMNITVSELVSDSDKQAQGMKMIADRVGSGASLSMMDLSVEAEAFGAQIRLFEDEIPAVVGSIVNNGEEAQALKVPPVGTARTGKYIDAIAIAARLITDRPIFAGVIGPFSLAGRLMNVTETLIYCYTEPETVHIVMQKTTDFLIEYIKAYREAGANGVVIAEPLTGLLSPAMAAEFSEPYVRQIADALQDDTFIIIYHNCGNNTIIMIDSIIRTHCAAYHFGNSISMKDMLSHVPKNVVVMGNVDPASQFRNGTPESIEHETKRIMSECCADYPNFVISSGCDIPPASRWENIDAFFSAAADYYASNT